MNVALISCSKTKKSYSCEASEMYSPSVLFSKTYKYCLNKYDEIYILSAKYGVITPTTQINTYNLSIKDLDKMKREEWGKSVACFLNDLVCRTLSFYTGANYSKIIIPHIKDKKIFFPLSGLGIGQRLKFLS